MKPCPISALLSGNAYPGRGIVVGKSADGTKVCAAYFIMGRSANSRNRVFRMENGILSTEPYDPAKLEDPSLIIYRAIRPFDNRLIVTNGDHTDTIYDALCAGRSFSEALQSRTFEPDAPNCTPRISAMITPDNGDVCFDMSILKSIDGTACARQFFSYEAVNGTGYLIHTYDGDGSPLPSYSGEPKQVVIPDSIDDFAQPLWEALDEDNKISLYVRYTDLTNGGIEERLFNKNSEASL